MDSEVRIPDLSNKFSIKNILGLNENDKNQRQYECEENNFNEISNEQIGKKFHDGTCNL